MQKLSIVSLKRGASQFPLLQTSLQKDVIFFLKDAILQDNQQDSEMGMELGLHRSFLK